MTAIGNDIVDLNRVSNSPKYIDRLFRYAFNASEIGYLLSDNCTISPWVFWSLKESSYKSALKMGLQNRFVPKNFNVELEAGNSPKLKSIIRFGQNHIIGTTHIEDDYVLSNTSNLNFHSNLNFEVLDTLDNYRSQSNRVRSGLLIDIEKRLGLRNLSVSKNEMFVPVLVDENDNELSIDLSLSHHGSFTSFSYAW